MKLDSLGLAVTNLRHALCLFEGLGYRKANQEQVAGVHYAQMEDGSSRIILLYGISRHSDVARSVQAYGPGPYRLCYTVADLDAAVEKLRKLYPLGGHTVDHDEGRSWISRREPVTGLIFELIELR
jgi:4-hydroxyphenylpyruvate dioxygenase-like putative hemolysin